MAGGGGSDCVRARTPARATERELVVVDVLLHLANDGLGLDVDLEYAVDRADACDHAAGAAVSSRTRAAVVAACRAAEAGRWPVARDHA